MKYRFTLDAWDDDHPSRPHREVYLETSEPDPLKALEWAISKDLSDLPEVEDFDLPAQSLKRMEAL